MGRLTERISPLLLVGEARGRSTPIYDILTLLNPVSHRKFIEIEIGDRPKKKMQIPIQ